MSFPLAKTITVTFGVLISSVLVSCGGGCPTIAIPAYEIKVYDQATEELICSYGLQGWGSCQFNLAYSEAGTEADISVSLQGYVSSIQTKVSNNTGVYQCFDQPSYSTQVEFHLEKIPYPLGLINRLTDVIYDQEDNWIGNSVLTNGADVEQFERKAKGVEVWANLGSYLTAVTNAKDSLDNYNLVIYRGRIPGEKNYVEVSEPQIVKGIVSLTMAQQETTDDGVHWQIGQVYQVHKSIQEFHIVEKIYSGLSKTVQLDLTESALPSGPLNCRVWEVPCYQCVRSYSGGPKSCDQQCQSTTPAKGICYSWF